jgi:AP2 domain-containing protein
LARIQLYNSPYFVEIDDADYALISQFTWYYNPEGYAITRKTIEGKRTTIWMHRLIMGAKPGQKVDHKDGSGLNNQRSNLRFATAANNMQNRRKNRNTSSKYKGVTRMPNGRWHAQVHHQRKTYHIGTFDVEEDAARAYDEKAAELFGEFAHFNLKAA